jgi:hypothetical protein
MFEAGSQEQAGEPLLGGGPLAMLGSQSRKSVQKDKQHKIGIFVIWLWNWMGFNWISLAKLIFNQANSGLR